MNVIIQKYEAAPKLKKRAFFRSVCLTLACVIFSAVSYAQTSDKVFSDETGQLVNTAMQLAHNNEFQNALDILEPEVVKGQLTPYERANMYQMIGQYLYALDRSALAQQSLQKAINSGGLNAEETQNLKVVITQLMIGNGQYREGAERLEAYLNSGGESKRQYVDLLVNSYVQAEDYNRALPWAEKWFNTAEPKQRKHYDLLHFLYNELDMPEQQLENLTQMFDIWPEDVTLLRGMMSVLVDLGREEKAFEVAKLLYLGGGITEEADFINLVRGYNSHGMPYQAAELLEREMALGRINRSTQHMKWLGELFIQAREPERALPILESIVEETEDVNFLIALSQTYFEVKACPKGEAVLKKAVARGYDTGKAHLLIGNCHYDQSADMDRLGCYLSAAERRAAPKTVSRDAALAAFKAVPVGSREKRNAKKWVQFIEAEISTIDERCGYGVNDEEELCYQKIKQAYSAMIFTDGFKLDDGICRKYIPEYDAIFRVRSKDEK